MRWKITLALLVLVVIGGYVWVRNYEVKEKREQQAYLRSFNVAWNYWPPDGPTPAERPRDNPIIAQHLREARQFAYSWRRNWGASHKRDTEAFGKDYQLAKEFMLKYVSAQDYAVFEHANELKQQTRFREAIATYLRIIAKDTGAGKNGDKAAGLPSYFLDNVWQQIGFCRLAIDDNKGALQAFEHAGNVPAGTIAPTKHEYRKNAYYRAVCLERMKQYDKAAQLYLYVTSGHRWQGEDYITNEGYANGGMRLVELYLAAGQEKDLKRLAKEIRATCLPDMFKILDMELAGDWEGLIGQLKQGEPARADYNRNFKEMTAARALARHPDKTVSLIIAKMKKDENRNGFQPWFLYILGITATPEGITELQNKLRMNMHYRVTDRTTNYGTSCACNLVYALSVAGPKGRAALTNLPKAVDINIPGAVQAILSGEPNPQIGIYAGEGYVDNDPFIAPPPHPLGVKLPTQFVKSEVFWH
jgi:tetratricopeptide (TPR) repeat protein